MENSIKPVEIDDGYADILKIKEQYAFRFGYTRPKEDLIAFKNRTIAAIASNIYDEFDLQFYTRKIFELLGYPYTGVKERVFDGSLLHQALGTVKIEKDKYILYIWFQKAQKQYRQALNDMLKGKYDRQVVDALRLTLELFLKQFLGNNKSLENQTKDLGVYLKDKNLSPEVSNMFFKLIDCYAKYNNLHAKHDDSVDENELDFLLYLTGSFIHFLIKINKKNVITADS